MLSNRQTKVAQVRVVDSHTGGEPTRVIVAGGPDLGSGPIADRLELFRDEYDHLRRAVTNEPRGSNIVVGALLCQPVDPSCAAGVIFFNNVGYLGMCVHGTIGLVITLAHLGRISCGEHRIETPVGTVAAVLHETGEVTVTNVPSFRSAANVKIAVQGYGEVHGDVAWGGNWFFLADNPPIAVEKPNIDALASLACAIRQSLERNGITGPGGEEIDHIELFAPSNTPGVNSRNFVLCPGRVYDRSPCGTGTSAKLACLYANGKLQPGEIWRQEGILGSIFEGMIRVESNRVIPSIKGSAFITSEAELILDPHDPFCYGVGS